MSFKSKAFHELILLHSKKPKIVKQRLKTDKRLNLVEKNILRGFLLMRDNENKEAHALAESTKSQPDAFVEAMRLYLIAGTLNNQGFYPEALEQFKLCYQTFPKNVDAHLEYVILNNIYVVHMNLHETQEAREILAILSTIKGLDEDDQLRLKRLEFSYHISNEDEHKSDELYRELVQKQKLYRDFDQVSLFIHFYNYGIIFNHFEICDEALRQLCHQKKYALTQNFNYMKFLLNHLRDQTPIYLRDEHFDGYPTLLAELKFIRALDQYKISELPAIWQELQKLNPRVFKDGYQYAGYQSAFSRCLELHKKKLQNLHVKTEKEPQLSILDAIQKKLENEDFVSKEQLFYYVYGRELESKVDNSRISKQVYKLKSQKNLEIRSVRGSYQLVKKAS